MSTNGSEWDSDSKMDELAYARQVHQWHSEGALCTIAVVKDKVLYVYRWPNDVVLARHSCCLYAHFIGSCSESTSSEGTLSLNDEARKLIHGFWNRNHCSDIPANIVRLLVDYLNV